ncbi:MAG: hypothetical protein ONB51_21965, partial [candidate division KSB1 bacterium]|nr:hypothetical protein [candidate division KSB1 bacterium]
NASAIGGERSADILSASRMLVLLSEKEIPRKWFGAVFVGASVSWEIPRLVCDHSLDGSFPTKANFPLTKFFFCLLWRRHVNGMVGMGKQPLLPCATPGSPAFAFSPPAVR